MFRTRVSVSRPGSEEGDSAEIADPGTPDMFRASLVRTAGPFSAGGRTGLQPDNAGLSVRQTERRSSRRSSLVASELGVQQPTIVDDLPGLVDSAAGEMLAPPGRKDAASAVGNRHRRKSLTATSSRGKTVSMVDDVADSTLQPPPSRPSVTRSHSVSNSASQSGQGSKQRAAQVTRLEDQILGTLSGTATDADYVRRVGPDGHVTLVRATEATLRERLAHFLDRASLGMASRLLLSLTCCFAAAVIFSVVNLGLLSDEYASDISSFVVRRHASLAVDCATAIGRELSTIRSPPTLSSTAACDPGRLREVATDIPMFLLTRFTDSSDLTIMNSAVTDFTASYVSYQSALRSFAQNSVVTDANVTDFSTVVVNTLSTLTASLTIRRSMPHARFGIVPLHDATIQVGVVAPMLIPAVVYASHALSPGVNASAGDPTPSDASGVSSLGLPTTTAYVDSLRRFRSLPSVITRRFGYSGTPITTNADDFSALPVLLSTPAPHINISVLSRLTASSRATQVLSWFVQATPNGITPPPTRPTAVVAYVIVFVPLFVFLLICGAVYQLGRWYQRRATSALETEIEQRSALQRAISAFVPKNFLALMGYETIRNIQLGDHREVELSMVFFNVHNYSVLSAGATSEKMFLLQQNLMTTAVGVCARRHGFLDKFMGDGAFVLFQEATNAVIASVELVQDSHDLAVRRRRRRLQRGTSGSSSRQGDSASASFISDHKSAKSGHAKRTGNARDGLSDVPYIEGDSDGEDDDEGPAQSRRKSTKPKKARDDASDNDSIEMDDEEDERAGEEQMENSTASSSRNEGMVRFATKDPSQRALQRSSTAVLKDSDRCRVGVGLHTGLVCVGILGDERRHSCTLISSKVNLASRLCKLTLKLRANILMSRDTYVACGEGVEEEVGQYLRPLGPVKVYGQKKEVDILEVFATDAPEVREYKTQTAQDWRAAHDLRNQMMFDEAQAAFRRIKEECIRLVPSGTKGVDGQPFVDVPLDLNVKSRQRVHVFTEK